MTTVTIRAGRRSVEISRSDQVLFPDSDLMVAPLLSTHAKYHGWRVALCIAGGMYASIVATALLLDGAASLVGIVPESGRAVEEATRFAVDYTFWLHIAFVLVAAALVGLCRWWLREDADEASRGGDGMGGGFGAKRIAAWTALVLLAGGLVAAALTRG